MTIAVDGTVDAGFDPGDGVVNGDGSFGWNVAFDAGDWAITGPQFGDMVTVDTDQRRVNLVFGFENRTTEVRTYTILIKAPVDAIAGGSLFGGFASGTVNDANFDGFAQVTSGDNIGAFNGLVDGTSVLSLLNNLDASVNTPGGGDTFGPDNVPPFEVGGAIISDIGIEVSFTLTPGDIMSMNTGFIITTPAPAALAMFGLAGLAGRGRRRRN